MAEQDAHSETSAEPPRRKLRIARGLRYLLYGLGSLLGLIVLALLVIVLLLQTPWGADRAKGILVDQLNPFFRHGATLQVDSVSGNFLGRLTLYDASLVSDEGRQMAHVDTLAAEYSLWRFLIYRRIVLRDIQAAGPWVHMNQEPDGTWDLLKALPASADTTTQRSAFALQIDDLAARNGSARVAFHTPERDSSILTAGDVNIVLADLAQEDQFTVKIDTVWGHFTPPRVTDPVHLHGSGALGDSILTVNRLRLNSSRSDVYAHGTLRMPNEEGQPLEDIDFTLTAEPLAFRDLLPFFPDINQDGQGTIRAQVTGTSRLLNTTVDAQFGDGSSLGLEGEVTPYVEGELTYQLDARVRELSPGYFTAGGRRNTNINANLQMDLTGVNLDGLNGTVTGEVYNTSIAQQLIRQAAVKGTFDDGHLAFNTSAEMRGASFTAEGSGRFFDDVPSYQAEGTFRNVHLGVLLHNEELESDLNGQFAVEGQSFDPETAAITADVSFTRSTLNGREIERGVATVTLEDGNLSYDVEFVFPGGTIAMQGTGQFEDGTFTYRVTEGYFQNLNLAAITGNPQDESDLTGTFTAQGRGLNPQTIRLQASLSLSSGQYRTVRINRANFDLTLQNQELTAGGRFDLVGGQFDIVATVHPFAATPTYSVEGNFQNVNLGTLLNNPQQESTLNGRLSLQGRGFNPETASLTGSFRLYDSVLNNREIQRGTADLTLRGGDLAFNVDFETPAGSIAAQGTGAFRQGVFSYDISEGRFENLDVSMLTGNPETTTDLTGTFTAQGSGTSLESLTLDVQATLERSRFNRQQIQEGQLTISIEQGQLDLTANVLTPEGRVVIEGQGNLLGETPTFALRAGQFEGLNVGAFLNIEGLNTSLNGTIRFTGEGQPQTGVFEVVITLRPSTINAARLQEGRIAATVRNGLFDADAALNFQEGRAAFTAQGSFRSEPPQYEAEGSLSDLDLAAALAGTDTLDASASLNFELAGSGFNPRTMQLRGTVSDGRATYESARVNQLETRFLLEDGLLRVDTLLVRANFADVTGSGQIAVFDPQGLFQSDFAFTADLRDLDPIRPFLPLEEYLAVRNAHIEGRAFGPLGTLRFEASTQMENLVYGEIRLADLEGRITGEVDSSRTLTVAEVEAEAGYLSMPQLTIENTEVSAIYDHQTVNFAVDMTVDQRRDLTLTGNLNMRPENQRLQIDHLVVHLDDDEWRLLQPATVAYDDGFRISNLLLYSESQQIAVDGVINPNGEQNLVVTVEDFRIGSVADLLNLQGLSGTMSGSIILTGPATSPEASGSLLLDLASFDQAAGDLRLTLDYANQILDLNALLVNENESSLQIAGEIPIDLSLAPDDSLEIAGRPGIRMQTDEAAPSSQVDLTIEADSFSVDWLRPFLRPERVQELRGQLSANITVSGTLESPLLDGSARLTGGYVRLPQLGLAYEDIQAQARLEDNQVLLEDFVVRSGDGEVTGEGTVDFTELTLGQFNIDLNMDNFFTIDTREYRAVTSGNLTLRGTTRQPVLRGDVQVESADIYLAENATGNEIEEVSLTDEDVQMLERNFGRRLTQADTTTFNFYEALDAALDVEIERDAWIRSRANPDMNIQFTGNLDFLKEPYSEALAYGTVEVIEEHSYIEQFGRRFNITSGTLRFNGPVAAPVMDISAALPVRTQDATRQDALTITLNIEGPPDDLRINLGSDVELATSDIVSYIATGQPAGQGLAGLGGQTLLGSGTDIALSQLTSLIEGAAGEELGLDVFEIEAAGPQGTVLSAGKYVTQSLFIGVEQPLSSGTNYWSWAGIDPALEGTQITVEYELFDWLLARMAQQGSLLRFDLFWEYSY